ncbi:molybdopterin-dependent oxidoreductase (plasmid) [Rhizobium sp. CB3090]|uniref:molybdopterin-containing oxidoreductase family protein n=1 Tax=Rhizobium sp. CB3090 TaxID=3039156 RepID=UPI0024B0E924|nr:molybdopterin-dependent oxidoreductase [Rhizobium sp. CB3090]WFU12887.1 molybdopterin-dependent oxidoreductase [Rhizobium sp. CB3090]
MTATVIPSTCKECYIGCGSLIHVDNGKIVRISGNAENPHSKGAFCVKGMNAATTALDHPDRLLYPLKRVGERGEGRFERVTWDEAFAGIAEKLGHVINTYGSKSVAGAVSNQFYDRGVAMALLLRSIGSPNYMINQDLCQGCRSTAATLSGVPGLPGHELKASRCILSVGKSPSDSNIVEWMNIKAAKQAGAKLIVIDPRRSTIAQQADIWLAPKPGTDVALALAMIQVIFEEKLCDDEFVSQWCTGVDELRERAAKFSPAVAQEITGVPSEDIVAAAREFATTRPGSLLMGHGIDAQANGVYTALAFSSLLALTGNIDRPGTNRLPKGVPGFREYQSFIHDPAFRMPVEREADIIGAKTYPFWSGPDSWGRACHNPSVIEAMLTGEPYPVRALYASGVNIVCTYPGMQNTIKALRGLDLFVAASDQMTPTAELADYVLPKTTQLEEEAVFVEGNCLAAIQAATPRRGDVKTDFEIAIGLRDALAKRGLVEFDVLPFNSRRDFIDFQLKDSGISFDQVCEKGFIDIPSVYESYQTTGFKTASGKIELASSKLKNAGYDPLPDFRAPSYANVDPAFDMILVTGIRTMALHHSRFRNHAWSRRVANAPELRIHPQAAEQRGLAAGDWAWIETPQGTARVLLKVRITDEVPPDMVATGMGWWYPELAGPDRGALTFNVEAAIPYGPYWDPISGSSESRNCACRVEKADPADVPAINGEDHSPVAQPAGA